jgi:hypothetical protein
MVLEHKRLDFDAFDALAPETNLTCQNPPLIDIDSDGVSTSAEALCNVERHLKCRLDGWENCNKGHATNHDKSCDNEAHGGVEQ